MLNGKTRKSFNTGKLSTSFAPLFALHLLGFMLQAHMLVRRLCPVQIMDLMKL